MSECSRSLTFYIMGGSGSGYVFPSAAEEIFPDDE